MKIVMIDDSAGDRHLCRILLEESYGPRLEFWEAETGGSGLEMCRTVLPDCILLDYKLPDMTGIEFLTRLRSFDTVEAPGTAVVMLTAMASEQVAVDALKAGTQDYLVRDLISAEALHLAIEKATQKIALISTLKEERDRLAHSLAEKEILLKEVHHRVKNNLQIVASLLRLQAKGAGELAQALTESQHRVESMALIHEQLYDTNHLRDVDLVKQISALSDNLFASYGIDRARIALHLSVEAISLGVDRAAPLGLILNELISNALKHAFPEGRAGSIWIEARCEEGLLTVEVRDDGVGLPDSVECKRPKSLGLEIVGTLANQLKGSLDVDRGRGTSFRISFPERTQQAAAQKA
ncbi:MAG: histidine kinase dimerization/phosphoacceptor domain -containing protein [Bryobacteraceae bacterium]|jgi:two-component sensor histidine kinase